MKSIVLTRIAATALFSVLAIPAQIIAQHEQKAERFPHYRVKDLGTLGGTFSIAFGINNAGRVGGAASLPNGNQRAFLWYRGHMLNLGTLGGPNSNAGGPNRQDELPILSETPNADPLGEDFCGFGTHKICLGAIWKRSVMTPLPTLGGNNGAALAINDRGQLVGYAENDTRDTSCAAPQMLDYEGVIWGPKQGEIQELRPLKGDTVGFALSINDRGEAVGSSGSCANTPLFPLQVGPHAVLWKNGAPINLGNLGGKINNTAASINDRGEVVGASDLPGDKTMHTFLWTKKTGIRDLGTLGNDLASLPGGMGGINNKGQVVGESCDVDPLIATTPPNCRAYLWQNNRMRDLNTLISADSSLHLLLAFGINEAGEIVGQAVEKTTGDIHAFLAIPCDEEND